MTFTFAPATREQARARIGLQGPAGCGKTKSALRIAEGLAQGGTIGLIDTERRSALTYAVVPGKPHLGGHEFGHMPMDSYDPRNLIQAVQAAEQARLAVLIVDSWSHFWNGRGGLLEIVENAGSGALGTFGGWKKGNPIEQDMLDALLNFSGHLIVTMRTKTDYLVDDSGPKKKITKVGTKVVQRESSDYELGLIIDMVEGTGTVIKTRYEPLEGLSIHHPGEDLGAQILEQLGQGVDPLPAAVDELLALVANEPKVEQVLELRARAENRGLVRAGTLDPVSGEPTALGDLIDGYARQAIVSELAREGLTYERALALHARASGRGLLNSEVTHPKTEAVTTLDALIREYGQAVKPVTTGVTTPPATSSQPPVGQERSAPPASAADAGQGEGPTPVTAPQMRMMHALFTKVGLGAKDLRAERHRATSLIIGRQIGSANELTKAEAQTLLDTLTNFGERNNAAADFAEMVKGLENEALASA